MKGTVAVLKMRARLEKRGPHLEGQVETESSDNGAPQVARRPEPACPYGHPFSFTCNYVRATGRGWRWGQGHYPKGPSSVPFLRAVRTEVSFGGYCACRLDVLTRVMRLALQRVSRRQKRIV